ncbi:phage holin family protein [Microbacterium sp. cx-55]|uniref:phage holin family protein n=1 Tax=unclassified Microbacterium TaxID=2609290 RepID=UPI001CBB882B|nr:MULTISPECIES: phage holin family protein [unclassified Microbacterium]MBZ4488296.1 phage holin family protein [Microbacterium sp. cx-55]MCC4909355.1 phage holin family protein [Microbacterium sp. cx-59]UGB34956.1 phage holin family protein [Microbacterium sp. cx-55]
MTTPRGFRDKSDESLLTLVGEIPELVRNLVVAEITSAKTWLSKAAKNAGIGAGWVVGALFVLFWSIPALGAFVIAGLSSWWPVWLSALVVFGAMLLIAIVLALLGFFRFKRIGKGNPAESIAQDVRAVKEAGQ